MMEIYLEIAFIYTYKICCSGYGSSMFFFNEKIKVSKLTIANAPIAYFYVISFLQTIKCMF